MIQGSSRSKLHVLNQQGADENHPAPQQITQSQLREVLILEEKVRMLQHEIMMKQLKIASAMLQGASVESGCHLPVLGKDKRRPVKIHPFRGAILLSIIFFLFSTTPTALHIVRAHPRRRKSTTAASIWTDAVTWPWDISWPCSVHLRSKIGLV